MAETEAHGSRLRTFLGWLRLLPIVLRRPLWNEASVFCHSWEGLDRRTVDREAFLLERCRGRRVLHFGFVDAPFSAERIKSGSLLHLKIQQFASYVLGLDIDQTSVELYRQLTGDQNNAVFDIIEPKQSLDFLGQDFDVILFPEILEHLASIAPALRNMRAICQLNPRAKLHITTPNAFSVAGFLAALNGFELVHPDHYCYFSPTTLRKALVDFGFQNIELHLYASTEFKASAGLSKHGLIATCDVSRSL